MVGNNQLRLEGGFRLVSSNSISSGLEAYSVNVIAELNLQLRKPSMNFSKLLVFGCTALVYTALGGLAFRTEALLPPGAMLLQRQ
jgi:hypothetical protein